MTPSTPTPRFRPVIRVFVSSTFLPSLKLRRASSDLRSEPFDSAPSFVETSAGKQDKRNALQAQVFSSLRPPDPSP
jgi:hypothetical protein